MRVIGKPNPDMDWFRANCSKPYSGPYDTYWDEIREGDGYDEWGD